MSDLENKLNDILSNPEALSSIINTVKGLSGISNSNKTDNIPSVSNENSFTYPNDSLVPVSNSVKNNKEGIISDKSIGLLLALKPFLSESKREKIDVITSLLKVAALADLLK